MLIVYIFFYIIKTVVFFVLSESNENYYQTDDCSLFISWDYDENYKIFAINCIVTMTIRVVI